MAIGDQYKAHGDVRPPLEELIRYFDSEEHSKSNELTLICADVCIDLAFADPAKSETWFGRAEEKLDDVVQTSRAYVDYGLRTDDDPLQVTAEAVLRNFDLRGWQRARRAVEIPPDYEALLEASVATYKHVDAGNPWVEDVMAEYVFLLIGAREAYQGRAGWGGRHSLTREDCRPIPRPRQNPVLSEINGEPAPKPYVNPNWDFNFSRTGSAEEFVETGSRVQVKRNRFPQARINRPAAYQRAGVLPVTAASVGCDFPSWIFNSCLVELGEPPMIYRDDQAIPVLTSGELDEIGGRMNEALTTDVANSMESIQI